MVRRTTDPSTAPDVARRQNWCTGFQRFYWLAAVIVHGLDDRMNMDFWLPEAEAALAQTAVSPARLNA